MFFYPAFDQVERINSKDPDSIIFIPLKHYNRFNSFANTKSYNGSETDFIKDASEAYFYYGYPFYLIYYDNENKISSFYKELVSTSLPNKKFFQSMCSDSHKRIVIYQVSSFSSTPKNHVLSNKDGSNHIYNGNMEIVIDNSKVQSIVSSWIKDGATFYLNDSVLFPAAKSSFVNSWNLYPLKNYPNIYLDNNNPINGEYSLHVRFRGKNETPLYLFNRVPAKECVLSFKIKSLSLNTCLRLYRYEYSNGKLVTPPSKRSNYFLIRDNQIHEYSLIFHESEISGDSMTFILAGSDTEFLIDDISCYSIESEITN